MTGRVQLAALAIVVACASDPPWLEAVGQPCVPTARPGNAPCEPNATPPQTLGCFSGAEVYAERDNASCGGGMCLVNRYGEAADRDGSARALRVHCTCACGPSVSLGGAMLAAECACPAGTRCQEFAGAGFTYASYCVRVAP